MTNPPSRSTRVAWAGVLALYLVARAALLDVPLDRDEGAFGAVGQAILRGAQTKSQTSSRNYNLNYPLSSFLSIALV